MVVLDRVRVVFILPRTLNYCTCRINTLRYFEPERNMRMPMNDGHSGGCVNNVQSPGELGCVPMWKKDIGWLQSL